MAKITLNLNKCVTYGRRVNACPDIFEMNASTSQASVIGGRREGGAWIGETDNTECAKGAAKKCIMQAISVEG